MIELLTQEQPTTPEDESEEFEQWQEDHEKWKDGKNDFIDEYMGDYIDEKDIEELIEGYDELRADTVVLLRQKSADLAAFATAIVKEVGGDMSDLYELIERNHPELIDAYKQEEPKYEE